MKIRTGNGTIWFQSLYLFWNVPRIFTVKIGIAGNHRTRLRQVDKSARGKDYLIWVFPVMIAAYTCEQIIHFICAPVRVSFDGSGKTERFSILAAPVYLVIGAVWWVGTWGAVVLSIYAIITGI